MLQEPEDRQSLINKINSLPPPKVVLVLSGKRKSGKDYLETLLLQHYHQQICSFRISAPIKEEFSKKYDLNYDELLSASEYKEAYRQKMVQWSETIRSTDPNYFLRLSLWRQASAESDKPIWLLNDARRLVDVEYFTKPNELRLNKSKTKIITVRLVCRQDVRSARGWQFTAGIDDQETECGLDSYTDWDYVIENNGSQSELIDNLKPLFDSINDSLAN